MSSIFTEYTHISDLAGVIFPPGEVALKNDRSRRGIQHLFALLSALVDVAHEAYRRNGGGTLVPHAHVHADKLL